MSQTTDSQTTDSSTRTTTEWLVDRIRFYDQVDASTVTADAPLAELGLDSIYVMTLCGDIEDSFGIDIDPPFFEGFRTLEEAGAALDERIASS